LTKTPKSPRVTRKVKAAIDLMVFSGQNRDTAADSVGLHRDSMRKALKRPDVLAYLRDQQQVLRTSEAARSIKRVADLADGSKSDAVKLDANELLLGLDGIVPVTKGEVHHTHSGIVPGLTVVFGGWRPHTVIAAKTGEAVDAPAEAVPQITMIGTPRPYPGTEGLPVRIPHPSEEGA
jgi:hypothetical protein